MSKPIILTGLRANSEFHLGNYLGAIMPIVELQKAKVGEYQINMFVPDLHSFTTPIDHSKLQGQIIENLRVIVASGLVLDQLDTYIYRQSYISAHSELTWILDCFTYFGEASRMTEFKDKSAKLGNESVSVGQFNYPMLMAADILLYGAAYVPVGDDQRQHLELARDLAIRINNKFNAQVLSPPFNWKKQLEFRNLDEGVRIKSLRNPEKKMSKSVDDPAGTILLSDKPESAAAKIMGATTDSLGIINLDFKAQPGISNLLQISALLSGETLNNVASKWRTNNSYGELKKYVASQVQEFLENFQAKLAQISDEQIINKLESSELEMRKIADATLLRVQTVVGLR